MWENWTFCQGLQIKNRSNDYMRNRGQNKNPRTYLMEEFNTEIDEAWIIDSGATHQVCNRKDWFRNFHKIKPELIVMVNGTTQVKGTGKILMNMYVGKQKLDITLTNVLYIPIIKRNLISISQIENKGKLVTFKQGQVVVRCKSQVTTIANNVNGLYKVKGRVIPPQDYLKEIHQLSSVDTWHQRLSFKLRSSH